MNVEEHRALVDGLEYEYWWNEREDPRLTWKQDVHRRDVFCIVDHDCEGELQAHHVITQQHLRKHGLGDWRWDRRIGVTVCELGHHRHHSGRERICIDALPGEVVEFVSRLLPYYLPRHYGVAA